MSETKIRLLLSVYGIELSAFLNWAKHEEYTRQERTGNKMFSKHLVTMFIDFKLQQELDKIE